jgi:soluble lytic murein transglycosylase-like protein
LNIPDRLQTWCDLIITHAGKNDIDPYLVAAVMFQESGGHPEVISVNGAVGLMQIMPSDGIAANFICVNGPCFANRPSIDELLDPSFNVDYGVRMLANLINKHGSEREALVAYGPMNVGYDYADKVLKIRENLLSDT